MRSITRAEARTNEFALLRLAAGPTRRHEKSRHLRHAASDAAVYGALVSHNHWPSGRCFPGYRALARLAGVALGTVSAAIHRLRAGGFIKLRRIPIRVPGHGLRWAHSYRLLAEPSAERVSERTARSAFGSKPESLKILPRRYARPAAPVRSVQEQLAILAAYGAQDRAREDRGDARPSEPMLAAGIRTQASTSALPRHAAVPGREDGSSLRRVGR
ncbi:helix-turn-helix domain-containing protein [Pseudoroseomonas globiformis]|uniref:Helix-turn-helix domain-containing protein n=1 Tax=Teichococcus globiformis TaxID=2307229 RepID=A0ABV7G734_9PROT